MAGEKLLFASSLLRTDRSAAARHLLPSRALLGSMMLDLFHQARVLLFVSSLLRTSWFAAGRACTQETADQRQRQDCRGAVLLLLRSMSAWQLTRIISAPALCQLAA